MMVARVPPIIMCETQRCVSGVNRLVSRVAQAG